MPGDRLCPRCLESKPASRFYPNRKGEASNYCIPCRLDYHAEWRARNRGDWNRYHREYRAARRLRALSPGAQDRFLDWHGPDAALPRIPDGDPLRKAQDELIASGLAEVETVAEPGRGGVPVLVETVVLSEIGRRAYAKINPTACAASGGAGASVGEPG